MERSYVIVSVPKVAKGAKDVKVRDCLFFGRPRVSMWTECVLLLTVVWCRTALDSGAR